MKKFIYILLTIAILFSVELYIDSNWIEISNYEIKSEKIPDSFDNLTILHLSDLHSKEFGDNNANLISLIDDIKPDIIMMTGDMVNSKDTNFDIFLNLAEKIGKKYECYYIVGNHELDLSKNYYNEIANALKSYGIKILDNEKIEIVRDNQKINLYGMWYDFTYYKKNSVLPVEEINKFIGTDDDNKFDLLLTHDPKHFDAYYSWGADLVLSGHIHGGMVRLPIVGPVFSPERVLFPKYSQGEYNIEGSAMIVSRGLGRGNTGFRLFNRPEIGVITLKSK